MDFKDTSLIPVDLKFKSDQDINGGCLSKPGEEALLQLHQKLMEVVTYLR